MKSTIRHIRNTHQPFNQTCRLSCRFERVTTKNTVGNSNVLTISAQYGLVNQLEYYNQQYASENTSGYTLLKKGEFAYNKSYSDGYPWGAIKRLSRYEEGIVSPIYLCFAAKPGTCSEFYEQYFEAGLLNREIYRIAQEGARNHGLLNIATDDFFHAQIIDPPLEEQKRIAEILECCDKVIRLKRELVEEKKKQKKSLMQKLLNPDSGFRLPGFKGDWKSVSLEKCGKWTGGGTPSKQNPAFWENGTIKWISSQEVKVRLLLDTTFRITEKAIKESTSNLVPSNSLIFVTRSGVLQHSFPIAKIIEPMAINQDIKALTVDERFGIDFVQQLLEYHESDILKNYIKAGTTVESLMYDAFKKMTLMIPEKEEQQAIATILSSADREIDLLEQDLAQWEQKKKSLAQLLLTGKARV